MPCVPRGGPTPAAKSRTEQDRTWRRRRSFLATGHTALVGATYLHAPSGRPVVVVDHEHRPARADGTRTRTGRVVVRYTDTRVPLHFVAKPAELLEQLALPYDRD